MTAGLIAVGILLAVVGAIGLAANGWRGIFRAWAIVVALFAALGVWGALADGGECDLSNYAGEVSCYDGP